MLRLSIVLLLLAAGVPHAIAGWSFDTGAAPELVRDQLAGPEAPMAPAGSWLRLREMERSAVLGAVGIEVPPWPGVKPAVSLETRRQALSDLRAKGYRLVGFLMWPTSSWKGGVRPDQPLRRLPLDLREAAARCRQLAATYGDLIDYWEIENEPDISFVEENPETYAAFLKACYLGFKAEEKPETGNLKPESSGKNSGPKSESLNFSEHLQISGFRSQVSSAASLVLMAPMALPPGPYFDAFVANDGLRYTDAFNYHYYGYPEDFTGVYQQFRAAVEGAPAPTAHDAGQAVFRTQFYPASTKGWLARTLSDFSHPAGDAAAMRAELLARPLATGEPALEGQGRWLVSPGTTVRETADGWEFILTQPAPGPLRPAMAELPLPDNWSVDPASTLAFEFRLGTAEEKTMEAGPLVPGSEHPSTRGTTGPASTRPSGPQVSYADPVPVVPAPSGLRSQVSGFAPPARPLPVFLTEYGYGLLGREDRLTPAGRALQNAWFENVLPQVEALGLPGAMAFLLQPYLEMNRIEFGLLQSAESGPAYAGREAKGERLEARAKWGNLTVSPALATLMKFGTRPLVAQPWLVSTAPPSPVVIDFAAGPGLEMLKIHRGYLMKSEAATGRLIVTHFGSESASGELSLEGDVWSLLGGGHATKIVLAPGERREFLLEIRTGETTHFAPQAATARFVAGPVEQPDPLIADAKAPAAPDQSPAKKTAPSTPPATAPKRREGFEVYFRTRNGNLYEAGPRLEAQEERRFYTEPLANFTPAFFGRAHLPAALAANQPAALAFFFRPAKYPAVYHVRNIRLLEFVAPK
jgi:hypothetical protein